MSSNFSGVVQTGKLIVHVAENGHTFEHECDESTLVVSVQKFLESACGIQMNNQLLLCLDMKLDPHRPLSSYKLPSNDREVFMFNKSRMRINSPTPELEQIYIPEIQDPKFPSSSLYNPHPLDEAFDPAMKALPSYERQFRHHYHRGQAIYSRTQRKFEICERLLRQQKVQERALEIARGNLDHFYRMILQNYSDFMDYYTQNHRFHSNLLVNFEKNVEKLRSCKLIPALQTDNRKCLLDFVKEENLPKIVEDCGSSHRQFENKVSEFKQEFGELKRHAEQLFASKSSFLIRDLELTVKDHQRYINEQKCIMQALSKDVDTVKKLVDDCVSSQLSSSIRPHDAVSALGPMYDVHDRNYLPKMQDSDREITKLFDFCKNKKNEMNAFVHSYMQKMAYIQYKIKDVRYKFTVFTEALNRQSDQFELLKIVHGIGPSYRSCLAEIVRRKSSMKLYMGTAGQFAEKLAVKREDEIRRREEFLRSHSSFVPRDILALMGLYDTPSQCDVNITPFDKNLLDIDISDVDRYAPEFLTGSNRSFSISSASSEIDELLESSGLVEISGTSKIEVENAKLKAELASTIALICSLSPEFESESMKSVVDRTSEALNLKDEYAKQIESMLRVKQLQCESYEKRIEELEQRLSDHYMIGPKISSLKSGDSKSESSVDGAMDETSCGPLDSSMVEPNCDRIVAVADNHDLDSKINADDLLMDLQRTLEEKSSRLSETEGKIEVLMEEVVKLERELEISRKLLDESQMNCAHLENCLHEAREEAQTHLCAADRRASQYTALRASAVKMRSLFERLRNCVSSAAVAGFAESLSALSQSLVNSVNEKEDDGTAEFRECIRVLADKVGVLSKNRLEMHQKAEAENERLKKELKEKKDLINTLYKKHQQEKQANKEKISFGRLQVHEIAAFVLNSAGHYEAINRASSHYYLSSESVALFGDHHKNSPNYIIGQIVHIERQIVRQSQQPYLTRSEHSPRSMSVPNPSPNPNPNPYGLPVGHEYFVVTVAMLPETSISTS